MIQIPPETGHIFPYFVCINRMFNKTIEILQGDIESLENDKLAIERRLLEQESKKMMLADTTSRRLRGSSFGSAFGLREQERRGGDGAAGEQQQGALPSSLEGAASPLLLARVSMYIPAAILC